jgi:CRISPR-associated protein Csm5
MDELTRLHLRLPLRLTTLSPVAVGDGGQLSPLTDYIWDSDNDEISLLDQRKFREAFRGKDRLMDTYINEVRDVSGRNRSLFLANFIKNNLPGKVADYLQKEPLLAWGVGEHNVQALKTIIREGGKPYLPGSSLKGALKTALLIDWMFQFEKGTNLSPQSRLKKLVATGRRDSIEQGYQKIEQEFFGDISNIADVPMDFSFFRVADAVGFSAKSVGVYNTTRLRFKPGSKGNISMPIGLTEAIQPNNTALMELSIQKILPKKHKPHLFLQDFWNEHTIAPKLFGRLNRFALQFLDWEKGQFERIQEADIKQEMSDYKRQLTDLEKQIREAGDSAAFLRVGGGKTYWNNSIGLTIANEWSDFRKLMKAMRLGKEGQSSYPITRRITEPDSEPMGWVKLEKMN